MQLLFIVPRKDGSTVYRIDERGDGWLNRGCAQLAESVLPAATGSKYEVGSCFSDTITSLNGLIITAANLVLGNYDGSDETISAIRKYNGRIVDFSKELADMVDFTGVPLDSSNKARYVLGVGKEDDHYIHNGLLGEVSYYPQDFGTDKFLIVIPSEDGPDRAVVRRNMLTDNDPLGYYLRHLVSIEEFVAGDINQELAAELEQEFVGLRRDIVEYALRTAQEDLDVVEQSRVEEDRRYQTTKEDLGTKISATERELDESRQMYEQRKTDLSGIRRRIEINIGAEKRTYDDDKGRLESEIKAITDRRDYVTEKVKGRETVKYGWQALGFGRGKERVSQKQVDQWKAKAKAVALEKCPTVGEYEFDELLTALDKKRTELGKLESAHISRIAEYDSQINDMDSQIEGLTTEYKSKSDGLEGDLREMRTELESNETKHGGYNKSHVIAKESAEGRLERIKKCYEEVATSAYEHNLGSLPSILLARTQLYVEGKEKLRFDTKVGHETQEQVNYASPIFTFRKGENGELERICHMPTSKPVRDNICDEEMNQLLERADEYSGKVYSQLYGLTVVPSEHIKDYKNNMAVVGRELSKDVPLAPKMVQHS